MNEFIAHHSEDEVVVRSPGAGRLAEHLRAEGGGVTARPDGSLLVDKVGAPRVGEVAAAHGIVLRELTPQRAGRTLIPAATGSGTGTGHANFGRLMTAECTKLRTVRSVVWSFVALITGVLGLTSLIAWLTVANWSTPDPGDRIQIARNPVARFIAVALYFGQAAVCVLGALVAASEYSTGMIRSTPSRRHWSWSSSCRRSRNFCPSASAGTCPPTCRPTRVCTSSRFTRPTIGS
jgi:hypothetical protein